LKFPAAGRAAERLNKRKASLSGMPLLKFQGVAKPEYRAHALTGCGIPAVAGCEAFAAAAAEPDAG
jgi:hypothetical protein